MIVFYNIVGAYCVVFTLNHSFYPTTSVHPVYVLILHPREIQIVYQTLRQRKTKTTAINQGKASEMLAYLVQHNKKAKKKKAKKLTGVLKNVIQEDQKGCKKNNIRAEEEQITAARTKQREDEEEDTGIRPAEREKNKGTKRETRQKNKISKTTLYPYY